ncbi:MAG TPA: aminoacyl--tRNA ligase-related protein [Patescibacteria group bacterium]|nr:aminoacyl--tRNA ligase-related protein [Patescibacteria group bacterium]
MKYSKLFGKSIKESPKDEVSINAKLLLRAGFIDKLMAGSYSLLPLGYRVKEKIEQIIREEMNKTGAEEMLMPLLHPKNIWNETGRWDSAKEVMYQFSKDDKEYALSFTHEEIVVDLIRKHILSYKDFPVKIYHFSTKFRSELRAKSGILRGREFLMKDLYSLHETQKELDDYYWKISDAYVKVFKRVGFDVKITEASGGVFTDNKTHEYQVLCESGEDIIYYCSDCEFAQNKEVLTVKKNDKCPKCKGEIKIGKAIEAGNIFRFGTYYSEKMNASFTDKNGKKSFPYFGSYGIGVTRLIGIAVELFHDDKGIVWPESIAPYQVHLIGLNKKAEEIYEKLVKEGIEVLFDDREGVSPGQKFADSDLIGIPVRLVVSDKTKNDIEWKKRSSKEIEVIEFKEVIRRLLV